MTNDEVYTTIHPLTDTIYKAIKSAVQPMKSITKECLDPDLHPVWSLGMIQNGNDGSSLFIVPSWKENGEPALLNIASFPLGGVQINQTDFAPSNPDERLLLFNMIIGFDTDF